MKGEGGVKKSDQRSVLPGSIIKCEFTKCVSGWRLGYEIGRNRSQGSFVSLFLLLVLGVDLVLHAC